MKREDSWITLGSFHQTETTELSITNEHGVVAFNIKVESMKIESNFIYIRYHLKQNDEIIDILVFECWWEPEV
ncbi:hypothetical protein H9L01_02515 [Erysipelothrix inopinata]|uniref:Uncharacterized protein n=1 Tax=Erysipelothrix inopinata TaxID=225084 RepID=A0A7G9S083_9FIRM|nr:hypothetical protein [Erysipelothrix inopinata]QNN61258.1 hypothetical protein H9L01_02515 [Erysipelothrix inopinata]